MAKVNITANQMLSFVTAVFDNADIKIDSQADEFAGKTLAEALNVEYYAFKKRPESTEQVIEQVRQNGGEVDNLMSTHRAFCCLTLTDYQQMFSADVDQVTVQGVLDFWIQTAKTTLLEYMITKCNAELAGLRIPVTFPSGEVRYMSLSFGTVNTSDIDNTQIGESLKASVNFEATFNQEFIYKSDYDISIKIGDEYQHLPIISFLTNSVMTQNEQPNPSKPNMIGMSNLANAKSFEIVCDGFIGNPAFDYLLRISLDDNADINTIIPLQIKRGAETYFFNCNLQRDSGIVADDKDNERHTFILTRAAETNDMLGILVNGSYVTLPTTSFVVNTQMSQQSIPFGTEPTMAGAFNVHSMKQFQFTCNNIRDNAGLQLILDIAMLKDDLAHDDDDVDINTPIQIQIMYNGEQFRYTTVLTSAIVPINNSGTYTIVLSQMTQQNVTILINTAAEGAQANYVELPCLSYDIDVSMTQKGIPLAAIPQITHTNNLGKGNAFSFSCQNLQENDALDFLIDLGLQTDTTLVGGSPVENNKSVLVRIIRQTKRRTKTYDYRLVLSNYHTKMAEDTGQPTHQFTMTPGGDR